MDLIPLLTRCKCGATETKQGPRIVDEQGYKVRCGKCGAQVQRADGSGFVHRSQAVKSWSLLQNTVVLAVIGTAGRKDDARKLATRHWAAMVQAAKKVCELERVTQVVSGGAAWADHAALQLGLPCRLYLPATKRDLQIAQYYHTAFSSVIGQDTWRQVQEHKDTAYIGNFKERNSHVAAEAHVFLACTFGSKRQVKDGGTLDTVVKMQERGVPGYHLNLHTNKLYKL